MITSAPFDALTAPDSYKCPCGLQVRLWWNGGDLDQHTCSCGRTLRTRHHTIVLDISEPGERLR